MHTQAHFNSAKDKLLGPDVDKVEIDWPRLYCAREDHTPLQWHPFAKTGSAEVRVGRWVPPGTPASSPTYLLLLREILMTVSQAAPAHDDEG